MSPLKPRNHFLEILTSVTIFSTHVVMTPILTFKLDLKKIVLFLSENALYLKTKHDKVASHYLSMKVTHLLWILACDLAINLKFRKILPFSPKHKILRGFFFFPLFAPKKWKSDRPWMLITLIQNRFVNIYSEFRGQSETISSYPSTLDKPHASEFFGLKGAVRSAK